MKIGLRPGDPVLLRHVWRDSVILAASVRVVAAEPDVLVTWLAPGTPYMRPLERSELPYGQPLVDRPWTGDGLLQVTRAGDAHNVWLFTDSWYVNMQEPLRPSRLGFDTCDQLLDLVRLRDGGWRWKDEHELDAAVERGFVSPEEAAAVRTEAQRVIAADPFPTGWEEWEPPPEWAPLQLPEGWDAVP